MSLDYYIIYSVVINKNIKMCKFCLRNLKHTTTSADISDKVAVALPAHDEAVALYEVLREDYTPKITLFMAIFEDYDLIQVTLMFICQKIVYAKYSKIIATAGRRR